MIYLYFDNDEVASSYPLPLSAEDEIIEQMKIEPKKRLYIYGVDFSRVSKVEVRIN